ncbi:predicted protein [Sclerotinia sclerotiorum 1980 UF-70]|uniref:Uncharacterized protein n=1 Tax=Sclerotinia sclerotiorum (strain ATCC 18683 / 1980 / Ss-1) TaxID=665079 RepID=A7EQ19_SCLS1|nr:predicted protein [Sclerotinia sclerotiorum 1980 UF-70]EDO04935.1 predicted protein [Sclerotinia sclerotiorum 1980 UF-70]
MSTRKEGNVLATKYLFPLSRRLNDGNRLILETCLTFHDCYSHNQSSTYTIIIHILHCSIKPNHQHNKSDYFTLQYNQIDTNNHCPPKYPPKHI